MLESGDLKEVFSTDNPTEAEIIRGALHEEGIKCAVDGESQAGLTGVGIMEIKILVRADDFDRASAFLKKHQHRS
jgi:hypothetical protein